MRLILGTTRCSECKSLVGLHWLIGLIVFFIAFFICMMGTLALINIDIGILMTILVFLLWGVVAVLRAVIVPLEIKQTRFLD